METKWLVTLLMLTTLLAAVAAQYEDSSTKDLTSGSCSCHQYSCECCVSAKLFHHKEKACAVITYLPKETGLEAKVTLNGRTVFKKKASVKNPPPLCAKVPWIKLAKLCLKFSDLKVVNKEFSGCAYIQAKLVVKSIQVKIGCWKMHLLERDVAKATSLASSLSTLRYQTWEEQETLVINKVYKMRRV